MEVFLRGVPKDLSDDSLRHELTPLMRRLGVEDWSCDKPKKKTQAWLTFLRAEDGAAFVARYGKVIAPSQPRSVAEAAAAADAAAGIIKPPGFPRRGSEISRLCILQADVYAEKSAKEADHLILNHLNLQKDERESSAPTSKAAKATTVTTVCRINSIASGKMIFSEAAEGDAAKSLAFSRQTECTTAAQSQFKRKSCILTTVTGNQMHISYATVEDCVFDFGDRSFTMILNESPRFYARNTVDPDLRTQWSRQPVLSGWPELNKYVAHCLVYRFQLPADEDVARLFAAIKEHHDVSVSRHTLRVEREEGKASEGYLECMQEFMRKIRNLANNPLLLPFVLLFQVHKMVYNNYLHPTLAMTMLEIMETLAMDAQMSKRPLPFSVESFKRLFNDIPYPTPGVKPNELDPFELLNRVMDIESGLLRGSAPAAVVRAGIEAGARTHPGGVQAFRRQVLLCAWGSGKRSDP